MIKKAKITITLEVDDKKYGLTSDVSPSEANIMGCMIKSGLFENMDMFWESFKYRIEKLIND